MATDPYGYPDSVAAVEDDGTGAIAMWTGFSALVLTMLGPCTCYVANFFALPVSLYALYVGYKATAATSAGARQMGLAGLFGGLIAFGFSALLVLFILMYVLIIFAAGFAGAMQNV